MADLVLPDDIPWLAPWQRAGVLFRCPDRARQLLEFLQRPVEGLKSHASRTEPTFMSVFKHHRDAGIMLLFFGGAVRQALVGDFKGINDIDVTFGAPPSLLVQQGSYKFSPVEQIGKYKVRWGAGNLVMEGNCILGSHFSGCYVLQHDAVVTNDLVQNLITVDFACNSVLYDPISSVFIDVTGHGLHDILKRRLRIPVARPLWDLWFAQNSRKVCRYWKMRVLGFEPDSDEMHDFLLKRTVLVLQDADHPGGLGMVQVLGKTKKKARHYMPLLRAVLMRALASGRQRQTITADPEELWQRIADAFAALP